MSANQPTADQLREELSARESEMVYRQANGEDVADLVKQVMAIRAKLAQAQ